MPLGDIFGGIFSGITNTLSSVFTTITESLFGEEDNGSGLLSRIGTAGVKALDRGTSSSRTISTPSFDTSRVEITAKQGEAVSPQAFKSVDIVAVHDKWIRLMRRFLDEEETVSVTFPKR